MERDLLKGLRSVKTAQGELLKASEESGGFETLQLMSLATFRVVASLMEEVVLLRAEIQGGGNDE